jgi:hypothetical protein
LGLVRGGLLGRGESRGGISRKEKGIVRMEFNEFNDQAEGD